MDSDEVPVYKVKEQRAWSEASHPSLVVVSNDRLKISFREMTSSASSSSRQGVQGQGLCQQEVSYLLSDYENGFTYWREAFIDLQHRELLSSAGGVHPVAISADDDAESVGWSFNRDKDVVEDDFDSDDEEDAVYGVEGGRIGLPPPAGGDALGHGPGGDSGSSVSTMSVESSKRSHRGNDKDKDNDKDSEASGAAAVPAGLAPAPTSVGMREPRPYYSAPPSSSSGGYDNIRWVEDGVLPLSVAI